MCGGDETSHRDSQSWAGPIGPGTRPRQPSAPRAVVQISLTGFLGGQSRSLSDLFTGPARSWNFAPAAVLPIFNAGRIRSNVRLTEALQREALINYQKTIQTSFREVSDALVDYRKTAEQRRQQELLVEALRETDRLSTLRYRGGLESLLRRSEERRVGKECRL